MKTIRTLLAATLLVATIQSASGQPSERPAQPPRPQGPRVPDNVELIKDVEYGKGADKPLLLDIARPKETPKELMPAVIWIHGGAWQFGDKRGWPGFQLPQHGYFTVSINYRLSGEAAFPAAIEDCKCAVRWLRENAEKYHIDPDRIGVWGGSAGGHLAMLVGMADEKAGLEGKGGHEKFSSRVQAVCSWYGPSDFTLHHERIQRAPGVPLVKFLGGYYDDKTEVYKTASPVTHVKPGSPPVLLMQGDKDKLVSVEQAEVMLAALKKADVPAELVIVKNAGHGFAPAGEEPISPSREEIQKKVLEFFDKYLKNAEQKPAK